ncbi:MAG: LuxR C-terminal-related transcriptional regulator [Coriobacteriales bacterium]|jgi:DNA-binding CsgD family transcriptional regulator|nr:LuxR C-terminal-related transcriptional regulator [Coriobacteriales bacterium]
MLLASLTIAFLVAGLLFMLLGQLIQPTIFTVILATLPSVLLAVSMGVLMQLWSLCYATVGTKYSIGVTCATMLLSIAFFFVVVSLPAEIAWVSYYLLNVFSAICLLLIKHENATEVLTERSASRSQWLGFWSVRILYGLAIGLIIGLSITQYHKTLISSMAQGISTILGFTLLVSIIIIYVSHRSAAIRFYWLPAMPLIAIALFLSLLIGSDTNVLRPIAIISAFICFMMLSSVQISNFRMLFGMRATTIAFGEKAAVFINQTLGLVIGVFAGEWLGLHFVRAEILAWMFTGILIIGTIFALSRYSMRLIEQDYFVNSPSNMRDILASRCHTLTVTYGLTSREEEVLCLLAAGRSGPYVTRELIISDGTFRTHSHHIYKKLGIHKNQELLDMMDNMD